jgi:hypothetical protein
MSDPRGEGKVHAFAVDLSRSAWRGTGRGGLWAPALGGITLELELADGRGNVTKTTTFANGAWYVGACTVRQPRIGSSSITTWSEREAPFVNGDVAVAPLPPDRKPVFQLSVSGMSSRVYYLACCASHFAEQGPSSRVIFAGSSN